LIHDFVRHENADYRSSSQQFQVVLREEVNVVLASSVANPKDVDCDLYNLYGFNT